MRPISRVRAAAPVPRPPPRCGPSIPASPPVMMVGERRDLRQVRHAQHLVGRRQLLQPPADAFRRAAADARIHFVEHQRANDAGLRAPPGRSSAPARCAKSRRPTPPSPAAAALRPGSATPETPPGPRPSADHGAGAISTRNTVRSIASCASSASTRFSSFRAAACARSVNSPASFLELRRQPLALPCAAASMRSPAVLHARDLPRAPPPGTPGSRQSSGRTCASAGRSRPAAFSTSSSRAGLASSRDR